METIFTQEALIGGLLIFLLRIIDTSMDTLRVLFVVRGRKLIVWILGLCQSIIFILAISNVLKGEPNPITIFGYAAGFATGNIVGMTIENQLAIGYKRLTIISKDQGTEIANAIREAGFGVTETAGKGKDGDVTLMQVNAKRKHLRDVEDIALAIDEHAFITVDDFLPVNRTGFWRK